MSLSTNVSNLATRIATEVKAIRTLVNGNVADLSSLTTTEKANLVAAINEIKGALDTAASDISSLETSVGDLNGLTTDAKNNLVAALNELQSEINNIDVSGQIDTALSNAAGSGLSYSGGALNVNVQNGIQIVDDTLQVKMSYITNYTDPLYDASGAAASALTSANSYTDSAIAALVDGAPALLDTLNELAAAINDDASFATTITNALATKADDSTVVKLTGDQTIAGVKTFTSAPVVPDSSFAIAKVDGLQSALDSKASAANVGDTTVNYVTTFEAGLV